MRTSVTQPSLAASETQGGQWYLCDDEHIRMASLADVLASEGYMLFYIKRKLEYE